jgi:hypothetical protein
MFQDREASSPLPNAQIKVHKLICPQGPDFSQTNKVNK